jgi:hypothetical protein
MSDKKMMAAEERFHELFEEKDSKKKTKRTELCQIKNMMIFVMIEWMEGWSKTNKCGK